MVIHDNEEMQTYSISENDYLKILDSKIGKNLIDIIHKRGEASKSQTRISESSSKTQLGMNFRLPSFPFCKTCNKDNTEFLKNREFLVAKDKNNNRVLLNKDNFFKKLANGGLKMDKNFNNIKMINQAIENYQIENGASPERDVDYNLMKSSNPNLLNRKLKLMIKKRMGKTKF